MHKHKDISSNAVRDSKKAVKDLLRYLNKYKIGFLIALILAMFATAFSVTFPFLLGKITNIIADSIFFNKPMDFDGITSIGILLITLYILSSSFSYIQAYILNELTQKVAYNLRKDISIKINKLPLKYFDSKNQGDILSRVTNDVDTIAVTLSQGLSQMLNAVVSVIGFLIMMLISSVQLTLIVLITLPLSLVIIMLVVKKSQKYFQLQQESIGKINGIIEESYSNHNIIKAYNQEETFIGKFNKVNKDLEKSAMKSQFISGLMMPVMRFISNLGYVAVVVFGANLVINQVIKVGIVQSFMQYVRRFNQPINEIAQVTNIFQQTMAASERVFEFLNAENEIETGNNKSQENTKGNVVFENVSFGYDDDKMSIKNFNIAINSGQKIAIVGPTGAGKTTLVNLLMRFYDPQEGNIYVDGVNIKEYKRSELRKLFGMVLQDTWLFEGTIKDNIAFSDLGDHKEPDFEKIRMISKETHIDHFIMSQQNGYNLLLNENADNISNGQKQLLTISRAMYEDSPMLILDEATSSVDTRSEILIQKAMKKLMNNRTSFIIAHRLSTIKDADLILVMKDGNIIETGNHDELMNAKGFYFDLYNAQFENRLDDEE